MDDKLLQQFERDGYVVIENFLSDAEIIELKAAGKGLTIEASKESKRSIFDSASRKHEKDTYFLNSGDKISYFYESGAVDENGKLLVDAELSLNKVGHALHTLHPSFRRITFDQRVKDICRNLRLKDPVVCQSMFIYKNPGVGGEVTAHQDSSYLFTTPMKLYGLWIPLDDASEENGCLWFAPGSHKGDCHRVLLRSSENYNTLVNLGPVKYPETKFVPVPVKKGSCVVIHGLVVHKSSPNKSNKARNVYTFHFFDNHECEYAKDNWLQANFSRIYTN